MFGTCTQLAHFQVCLFVCFSSDPASFIGVHQANFVVNNDNIEYLFLFVREGSLDVSSEVS